MCGIAGILHFGKSPEPVSKNKLIDLRDAMAHRGPDGCEVWLSTSLRVGLAHRRLAIIDLSADAKQPMSSMNGRWHIVFNGMIYNHNDLRNELTRFHDGPWLTHHSDTEVLLRAWEKWGVECVHRLHGMFAFAVWDDFKEELWLVRDRLGIKPLYYSFNQTGMVFGSEVQALVKNNSSLLRMNPASIAKYFHFGYLPGEETAFQDIKRLMPGHWMCVKAGGSSDASNYWDALQESYAVGSDEADNSERLLNLLKQVVEEHTQSDVPIGMFLSGGVDSSLVSSLSASLASEVMPTFTIGYGQDYEKCRDETIYARMVSEHAGTRYLEKTVTPEEFELSIPSLISAMAEPCSVYHLPLYLVTGLACEQGIRVLLSGEGADEVFLGYPQFSHSLDRENKRLLSPFRSRLNMVTGKLVDMGIISAAFSLPRFSGVKEGIKPKRIKRLFDGELSKAFDAEILTEDVRGLFATFANTSRDFSPLQWMSYVDLHMRLSSSLLPKLDVLTMMHGIECRVPYLDHRLVQFGLSVPTSFRYREGEQKIILRNAARSYLPSQIIDRKKQGLFAPYLDWFDAGLKDRMFKKTKMVANETGLLNIKAVEEAFHNKPYTAWLLHSFALWYERFFLSTST